METQLEDSKIEGVKTSETNEQPSVEPETSEDKATANEPTRDRLPRGAKPPKLNLEESVEIVKDFYERAGGEGSEDVLSEIMNNSRSSSTFRIKLGMLKNFELIESDDNKIKLSAIGNSIVAPKEKIEQMKALKEAFLKIETYKTVYDKFSGRMLAQDEFLINSFTELVPRKFGAEWMESFKASANYAGLLIDRGEGRFQVRADIGIVAPSKIEEVNKDLPPEHNVKPDYVQAEQQPENAIRRIQLTESNKAIWIGTDANMFQIRSGKDMDFVLALIKLFDEYERPIKGQELDNEN